ncbi:hypothetical protein GCM10022267_37760 [Lentzea roselyniae]|uniref:Uncharacterized protein n=1 Tax=Lentzea roselyniae TaxID=531940 RepID=A0ABP7B4H9_9PSEU
MSSSANPHSGALGRFVYNKSWTPVLGAYMFPLKYFSLDESQNPDDYLEVVQILRVDDTDIAITRGGGLFVRVDRVADYDLRQAWPSKIAETLNYILCELAINGVPSHPINPKDVQDGKLIGTHAAIYGGGGRHGEQAWGPFALLAAQPADLGVDFGYRGPTIWPANYYWTAEDPQLLNDIADFRNAQIIRGIGARLPELLVAAAHHASRGNVSETVLAAWILCEALISGLWDKHVSSTDPTARRNRLR